MNKLELDIPPKFVFMDTNKTPEYISKFPLGKIPALETASGFKLTESSAIAFFLAESGPKSEQLLGSGAEERALVHQWASFTNHFLYSTIGALIGPYLGLAPFDVKIEGENLAELKRWFEYLEEHLNGRTWLVSDEAEGPSIADLSVAGALRLGFRYYLDIETRKPYPTIVAWYERLLGIPEINQGFGGLFMLQRRGSPRST
jgi:elongation factor 1-gamma